MKAKFLSAILLNVCFVLGQKPISNGMSQADTNIVVEQRLPSSLGQDLRVTLLRVTYPPAAYSRPHTHPCPVIGYVLSGELRFRVGDAPERVLRTGDSFYEPPDSLHVVSANASTTDSASFLAYFLCVGDQPLSKPPKNHAH